MSKKKKMKALVLLLVGIFVFSAVAPLVSVISYSVQYRAAMQQAQEEAVSETSEDTHIHTEDCDHSAEETEVSDSEPSVIAEK